MQRESIERLLGILNHGDYYTSKLGVALIEGASYEEAFKIVPVDGLAHNWWSTFCTLHEMVVVWKPEEAHRWLQLASQPLQLSMYNECYARGSIIGFLKAGIWLDEKWEGPLVEYHTHLLPTLAKIICAPAKLKVNIDAKRLREDGFEGRLAEEIRKYAFPHKEGKERKQQVAEAVAYIHQHGRDENFSCLDELIIERLSHGLLAKRPATQKVAGINHILSKFKEWSKPIENW